MSKDRGEPGRQIVRTADLDEVWIDLETRRLVQDLLPVRESGIGEKHDA
jgi:hypothetical protein